ncbi:hypothetical protein A0H81_12845 [Grifola frondosa]|uniref:Uncharacterized protein n=1 Tax=Grifola frondosa TaxID=5627 RepID=A0A1C7LW93_GRIFR|nr:hypothetical protein A0H81_12845 [Grifola frondosa]
MKRPNKDLISGMSIMKRASTSTGKVVENVTRRSAHQSRQPRVAREDRWEDGQEMVGQVSWQWVVRSLGNPNVGSCVADAPPRNPRTTSFQMLCLLTAVDDGIHSGNP